MTTLSTHVLDVESGRPAVGVPVTLHQGPRRLARSTTDADGRIADFAVGALSDGVYRLEFEVAAYFEAHGRPAPFLQRVSVEFAVRAADPHYHVPLLLTPYACTSYRGS